MANLFYLPHRPVLESANKVTPGAQAWFTLAGSDTPADVYVDDALTTVRTNPVVANSIGRFPDTYMDEAVEYRVRIYDNDGETGVSTPIEDHDPYRAIEYLLTFTAGGTGAVPRSFTDKMRDVVSVKDYGATGDGATNDGAAIQAALDAGASEVIFPAGVYIVGDVMLRPTSGTRLIGTPGQSILSKTTTAGPYRTRAFIEIEDEFDVLVEGLEFRYLSNQFEFGVVIRATTLASAGRVTVRDCTFSRCYAFIQRFVDGVTIENNKFLLDGLVGGVGVGGVTSKTTGTGGSGAANDGLVNNVRIVGNYFEDAFTEAVDVNWHTRNIVIAHNYCYNCNTDGVNEVIDVGGDVNTTAANQCRNIVIAHNNIVNDVAGATSTVAIHIKGRSNDAIVEGNVITRTGSTGGVAIRVWNSDDVIIRANTVSGYDYAIATTDSGESLPQRVVVDSNITRDYGVDGMEFRGVNFTIVNNQTEGTGSTGAGIDIPNLTRSTISGNKVVASAASGIRVSAPSADLTITDNRVYGATVAGANGFSLAADRCVIMGNTAEGNANHGFNISGTRHAIKGNIAFNNGKVTVGGDGFSLGAIDYSVVEGNTAFDNQGVKTQDRGFVFTAADRVIVNNNISYGNTTNALSGTGSLTNSLVGTAGNIAS